MSITYRTPALRNNINRTWIVCEGHDLRTGKTYRGGGYSQYEARRWMMIARKRDLYSQF